MNENGIDPRKASAIVLAILVTGIVGILAFVLWMDEREIAQFREDHAFIAQHVVERVEKGAGAPEVQFDLNHYAQTLDRQGKAALFLVNIGQADDPGFSQGVQQVNILLYTNAEERRVSGKQNGKILLTFKNGKLENASYTHIYSP